MVFKRIQFFSKANVRIVNTVREGKFIFYTINEDRIADINKFVNELVG